ncbi:MAG: hypothetical protein VR66_02715 [Peptococcaceae bacterium BRH_c23]|nr:MAG: hypothetical protein VR66_02715 [Peptococcaceae bacterium BRH_c23]KJS85205.1 MAG: hypothetical protein JL57_19365 [Desulfosporosinus sp. BICA1-9]HBW38323.1 hypothetical protein [Desulfosporosinus sp.]
MWVAWEDRSKLPPMSNKQIVVTIRPPKWSLSFPANGWAKAYTIKLSIDIEVTTVLSTEKFCSQDVI